VKKIISTSLMTLLILTTLVTPALAAPKDKSNKPTEGVMSSDPMFGTSHSLPDENGVTATGSLLPKGISNIKNMGNGTVEISGNTTTSVSVNTISVTIYLQKWNGSQWVDITGVSNSATNTNSVFTTKNIAVSPGVYYRARGVHTANNGTTTETQYSTSTYILVN